MVDGRHLGRGARAAQVRRIRDALRSRIFAADSQTGSRLPMENELVRIFDAPRAFIRDAQALLAEVGIVHRRRGVGTMSAAWNPAIGIDRYRGVEGTDFGGPPADEVTVEVIEWSEDEFGPELGDRLDQAGTGGALYFEFLVWWHGTPVGFGAHHVRAPEHHLLDRGRVSADLMGSLVEIGLVPDRNAYVFRAALADRSDAALLGVRAGSPIMLSDGTMFNADGERVAVIHSRTRGELSSIALNRRPHQERVDLGLG